MDTATRLAAPGTLVTADLEVKRSTFHTVIARVDSDSQAREFIHSVKARYPDARHHCTAYVLAPEDSPNLVLRSSDDGEPAGTAGTPMLDVLVGSGIHNLCAVVVRYFGGVKLGTGGLVRAYSEAVAAALPQVASVWRVRRATLTVDCPHAEAGKLEAELRQRGVVIRSVDYDASAHLHLAVADAEEAEALLAALTAGAASPRRGADLFVELPEDPHA